MNVSEVNDNVDNLQKMQKDLMFHKQKIGEITHEKNKKEREALAISAELTTLKRQLESGSKDTRLPGRIESLQVSYDSISQEANQAAIRNQQAHKQIDELGAAIAEAYKETVTITNILEHQQKIDEAESQVVAIQLNIKKQEDIINRKDESREPLAGLLRQKEDILAEMASGKEAKEELENIEAIIVEHEQQNEQHQKVIKAENTQAQATKAGLVRKHKVAIDEANALKNKSADIVKSLLFSEAEAVGAEFVKTAGVLTQLYTRLRGFHNLMKQQSNHKAGLFNHDPEMIIPSFRLPSFQQAGALKNGRLFDSLAYQSTEKGKTAHLFELERFREANVTII